MQGSDICGTEWAGTAQKTAFDEYGSGACPDSPYAARTFSVETDGRWKKGSSLSTHAPLTFG